MSDLSHLDPIALHSVSGGHGRCHGRTRGSRVAEHRGQSTTTAGHNFRHRDGLASRLGIWRGDHCKEPVATSPGFRCGTTTR
jgi:hypothetical protein